MHLTNALSMNVATTSFILVLFATLAHVLALGGAVGMICDPISGSPTWPAHIWLLGLHSSTIYANWSTPSSPNVLKEFDVRNHQHVPPCTPRSIRGAKAAGLNFRQGRLNHRPVTHPSRHTSLPNDVPDARGGADSSWTPASQSAHFRLA
ncbi:hypothetical protein C8Q79DRAFT_529324 [Trametes meyenii]|nr:hypothetical protein C8Q79DRAFT_529324 [Trametes meyenii]